MTHFDEGFTFIWKIENYSMLPHKNVEKLDSPKFVVEFLDKSTWCLRLYPKGNTVDDDKYLSLYLCRCDLDKNKTALKVHFNLSLESVNNAFEKSMSTSSSDIDEVGFGWNKFQELKIVQDNISLYVPHDILTIGCHISPSQEQCKALVTTKNYFENQYSTRTTIAVQKRVLAWPITKISELKKSKEKISINLASNSEDSPALKLLFYIDKSLNDNYAQIEILKTRCSVQAICVKCKISVVSADKTQQTSSQDSHLFDLDMEEIWHFPNFIIIENIDEYVYVDDTMFLQCEFTFSCVDSKHDLEIPMYLPFKERSEKSELGKNIQVLFKSKKFCDVELRAGNQAFSCHKLVICAQSPVFSTMFESDMKEKETGVVEITDVDAKTLEKMLNFLYLEVLEEGLSVEEICELYSAADKYEVFLLQRRCSLMLLSKLSVASVCRILATADIHQDHFLLTHVNNFLSIHAREVFHSSQWKTFMVDNPTLSKETMIKIYMQEP